MSNFAKVMIQYFDKVSQHPSGVISIRHGDHTALVFPGKKPKLRILDDRGLVVREKRARLWRISWELLRWKEMIS